MDTKQLSKDIMAAILPHLQNPANTPDAHLNAMMGKVKTITEEAFDELAANPDGQEELIFVRGLLKRELEKDPQLQVQFQSWLAQTSQANAGKNNTVTGGKNVVQDSNISAGGNVQVGDTINNSGQVKNQGNVGTQFNFNNNQGVINITQVVDEARKQKTPVERPTTVQEIQSLAQQHNVKPAIEKLLEVTSSMDSTIHNQAIMLASRWNRLQNSNDNGVISFENFSIEENRIIASLLSTLSELN